MSNYRESEYALNYKKAGIVYRFADCIIEISVEEFLLAHPDLTQQDFLRWKQISDEMYLQEKLANWRCTHKDCWLDAQLTHDALTVPSAEEALLDEENRKTERLAHRQKMHVSVTKSEETQENRLDVRLMAIKSIQTIPSAGRLILWLPRSSGKSTNGRLMASAHPR